jgi:pimeloyl-ACP methyl ester carboxylesterase
MIKKLVDIGTKKLEVGTYGTGLPIVVIETGMGCSWYDWCEIISEISKRTTVLAYHRSGYGKSTLGKEEHSTKQIAEDLNKLLDIEGISSPIVLVGHSFGGLCVQHYANLFSEKVSGMVLIDSNSIDEYKIDELRNELPSFSKTFSKNKIIENWKELSLKKKVELEEIISPKLLPDQKRFSEEIQKCILNFQINPTCIQLWHQNLL